MPIGPGIPTPAPVVKPKPKPKPPANKIEVNKAQKAAGAASKAAKSAKPKKKKKPSATQKYLAGDTTYQQQLADFNRSKADFESNYKRQTGIVNRDYAESQRTLNRQGAQDRIDQQNDFAGRGILRSGVFAKALGDYNTEFNTRMKALTTGRTDQIGDLGSQRTSFLRQLAMEMNNAKQDAIRRRAAKLGI
jgi:hypothetical protein